MSKSPHVTGNAAEQMRNSAATNALSMQEHKQRIEACHKETDPWEMGEVCAAAFDQLKPDDLATLRKGLSFGSGNFLKYASIGRTPQLYDPKIKAQLPKAMSTLYQISLLKVDELAKAMAAGMIKPDVKRAAFIKWKRELRGEAAPVKKTLADRVAEAKPEVKAAVAALFKTQIEAVLGAGAEYETAPALTHRPATTTTGCANAAHPVFFSFCHFEIAPGFTRFEPPNEACDVR
jgi:hypothetical protein